MTVNGVNNAHLNPIQRLNQMQAAVKTTGTIPIVQTKTDSDDFYGGMLQLNNKVPTYTGPESMGNYLDYLVNANIL